MDTTTYRLVFEPSFDWSWITSFLLFPVVSGVFFYLSTGVRRAMAGLITVAGILMVVFAACISYLIYDRARDAAQSPNTPIVEGPVEHLVPGISSVERKRNESFIVHGIPFSYSDAHSEGGFHKEGLIREGQLVRIRYLSGVAVQEGVNLIVKLEVADRQGKARPAP